MSEPSLQQAQWALHQLVTRHPQVVAQDLRRVETPNRTIGSWFAEDSCPALLQRLNVYSEGYHGRIAEALAEAFPATAAALQPEPFGECVWRYLRQLPSRQSDLRWVGDRFVQFLRDSPAQRRFTWEGMPWLPDVAALEWAHSLAFDAEDPLPLRFEQLQQLPPELWAETVVAWQPSVQRLDSPYALVDYLRDPSEKTQPTPGNCVHYLVWRQGLEVRHEVIGAQEARLLDRLGQGLPLADFCVQVAQCLGLAPTATARATLSLLQRWTSWQCLRAVP